MKIPSESFHASLDPHGPVGLAASARLPGHRRLDLLDPQLVRLPILQNPADKIR